MLGSSSFYEESKKMNFLSIAYMLRSKAPDFKNTFGE